MGGDAMIPGFKLRPLLQAPWLLLAFLLAALPGAAQEELAALRKGLAGKDSITVVVTDSGLGGLSVVAGVERRASRSRAFRKVRLVFVNAIPNARRGYNKMAPAEKAAVFHEALQVMQRRFRPDAILIACNTLSVVYPETRFARSASVPVIGIVGLGVDLLAEALTRRPDSIAMIYGTETTIESGAHREGLLKRGIPAGRIVTVPCPDLAGKIQNDAASTEVKTAVAGFVRAGMAALPPDPHLVVGLCCTHYGYSSALFARSAQEAGAGPVEVLNPNDRMSDLLFLGSRERPHSEAITRVAVYSRAELNPGAKQNIADLVRAESPKTAAALLAYTYDPGLWPEPAAVPVR
jgi:glutamate racemase